MTNCRIPRVLFRDDDVTDHAPAKNLYCLHTVSVTILMNSRLNYTFAFDKVWRTFLSVFRTFHLEPLITQTRILNLAEPVDRFNFSLHLSTTQFISRPRLYQKQYDNTFFSPTLSYRIKRQVLKKVDVLSCQ